MVLAQHMKWQEDRLAGIYLAHFTLHRRTQIQVLAVGLQDQDVKLTF